MELAGANCFGEVAKLKPSAVASRLRWAAGALMQLTTEFHRSAFKAQLALHLRSGK